MTKLTTIQQVVDAALAMSSFVNKAFSPGRWECEGFGHLSYLTGCLDTGHPVLFEILFSPPADLQRRPLGFPHGDADVTAIISYGDGRQGWSVGPDGTTGDVMANLMGYKEVLDVSGRGGNIKDNCHPRLVGARDLVRAARAGDGLARSELDRLNIRWEV